MSSEQRCLTQPPVATTEMLIRRPVAEVFEALVDPAITAKFWFSKGSGRLEPGARVRWEWEMYDASAEVTVQEIVPNERITLEWPAEGGPTTLEFCFTPLPGDTTFVSISNSGFQGSADEIVAQAMGAMEGFTFVLAGLKAMSEHDLDLRLVADRFPAGLPTPK